MSGNIDEKNSFLRVEGLCVDEVLKDVSFSFGQNGIHGILAPGGTGKTTLMEVLSCSLPVDGGSFSIGELGTVTAQSSEKQRVNMRKKIGYVREESVFYPEMTVYETMDLVGSARGVESGKLIRQIKEALMITGLSEIEKRLVRNLSLSELKKLDLAAALLGNPDIILVDGLHSFAFGGNREEFFDVLKKLGGIKPIVVAAEELSVVRGLCDEIVIMSDGKVLGCGSFSEFESRLTKSGETLEALYGSLRAATENGKRSGDKKC